MGEFRLLRDTYDEEGERLLFPNSRVSATGTCAVSGWSVFVEEVIISWWFLKVAAHWLEAFSSCGRSMRECLFDLRRYSAFAGVLAACMLDNNTQFVNKLNFPSKFGCQDSFDPKILIV